MFKTEGFTAGKIRNPSYGTESSCVCERERASPWRCVSGLNRYEPTRVAYIRRDAPIVKPGKWGKVFNPTGTEKCHATGTGHTIFFFFLTFLRR